MAFMFMKIYNQKERLKGRGIILIMSNILFVDINYIFPLKYLIFFLPTLLMWNSLYMLI